MKDIFDAKENIEGGVRYLRVLANEFDGDMVKMVAGVQRGARSGEEVQRAGAAATPRRRRTCARCCALFPVQGASGARAARARALEGTADESKTTMPSREGSRPTADEEFLGALYKGGELLGGGKIVEAREHLEQAHELQPKNEKAQNLLGLTYFKLGLFDRAAGGLRSAGAREPGRPDPAGEPGARLPEDQRSGARRSGSSRPPPTSTPGTRRRTTTWASRWRRRASTRGPGALPRRPAAMTMAEKMERALEARGSVSSTGTGDVPMTPSPPSEPAERPMLPPPTPPSSIAPPPQRADHAEEVGPEATLDELPARPPESEARSALASDWGEHVPGPSSPVPEFTIEERTEAHGPDVRQPAPDPSFAMSDMPLVPVGGPLEPLDVPLEGLPAASETLPVLEGSAVEVITLERAPSQPAEPSIWLTEHVADVPLTAGEPSPAPRRAWNSPSWVDAPDASAPPQWTPATGEAAIGWMNEPSPPQDATPVSEWPTEEALTGSAEELSAPSAQIEEPPGSDEGPIASPQGPTLPEPPQVDESNWVMQPVSEAFATEQAPPAPAPSTGFAPMPARRLAELGQTPPWVHESAAEPFLLGPEGLAVTVAGEMLVRMEGLVAVVGSLTIDPETATAPRSTDRRALRRRAGAAPSSMGHGVVYLEGAGGFHSLDLRSADVDRRRRWRLPAGGAGLRVRGVGVLRQRPAHRRKRDVARPGAPEGLRARCCSGSTAGCGPCPFPPGLPPWCR